MNYELEVTLIIRCINWKEKNVECVVNKCNECYPSQKFNWSDTTLKKVAANLLTDITGYESIYKDKEIINLNLIKVIDDLDRKPIDKRLISFVMSCIVPEKRLKSNNYKWNVLDMPRNYPITLNEKDINV